jgi:hypothetical protein
MNKRRAEEEGTDDGQWIQLLFIFVMKIGVA